MGRQPAPGWRAAAGGGGSERFSSLYTMYSLENQFWHGYVDCRDPRRLSPRSQVVNLPLEGVLPMQKTTQGHHPFRDHDLVVRETVARSMTNAYSENLVDGGWLHLVETGQMAVQASQISASDRLSPGNCSGLRGRSAGSRKGAMASGWGAGGASVTAPAPALKNLSSVFRLEWGQAGAPLRALWPAAPGAQSAGTAPDR